MFKRTDPQRSIFESEYLVPQAKAARLKKSWAEPFRQVVLPAIDEEMLRDAYSSSGTGRPNKSVKVLVCLHLLKEWHDLTDEQVIEQFEYNLQWHYALEVAPEAAHICQKTLHNFRMRLMKDNRAQRIFEGITQALAKADGISFGQQRMDSTHVISNIAQLTRLGLFVETVSHFLRELKREHPAALDNLAVEFQRRYLEREGYFSDATKAQAQRRLPVVAQDIYALLHHFKGDEMISELASYALLKRLFSEQCELHEDDDSEGPDEPNVVVRKPSDVKSTSLQSPYDADATYGRKGKGYEVQVAETCDDDNPYQLITATEINGAHESDQRALIPMLEQLDTSKMAPDELLADTGYGSGANIVAAAKRDVELIAPVQGSKAPEGVEPFSIPAASTQPEREIKAQPDLESSLAGFTFDTTCSVLLYCPQGQEPVRQEFASGRLNAKFDASTCTDCPSADRCPTLLLKKGNRRILRAPATIATKIRQVEQQQSHFKERYRKRSGIESTNAEIKGKHGLNNLRVRGRPRVRLVVILKSMALNVKRAMRHQVQLIDSLEMVAA